jgi:hypothetical protein
VPDGPLQRADPLILAGFFLPLGIYLLALGHVNRRVRPLMLSGTWDAVGLLFGLSGFLILGGPAVLTAVHERWRILWLTGDAGPVRESLSVYQPWWVLAGGAYFVAVVAGCAWHLSRAQALTSVYNVEPELLREELNGACRSLGLSPLAAGDLYQFGEGDHVVLLDLEPFEAMKHVTLRWSPYDSPLRPVLERELARRLDEAGSPDHEAGLWLTTAGLFVLLLALVAVLVVTIRASMGY